MENVIFNKCQTPLEELKLETYPQEVQDAFWDYINNVPFIRWMVSKNRPFISELPRDEMGRAIIDVTKPPILEGTDYFRQTAMTWQETGQYTHLRPNANPQSDFGKWLLEERRRSWEGYVSPDTGMWVTGDHYFFLNYSPIQLIKQDDSGKKIRVVDLPNFWDGHFLLGHYLERARKEGHHAAMLSSRGKGKSFWGASMLSKRIVLGESERVRKKVQCVVTAADRKYIYGANQILNMFCSNIDFLAINTQFASHRLVDSAQSLNWVMGYKDKHSGVRRGSGNSVMGITSGDDQSKLNGTRGVLYLIEEAGIFKDLLSLYQMIRPSVEDGQDVYGLLYAYGCVCAGTKVWTNDGRYLNIEDLHKEDGIIGYEDDLPVKNTIGTLLEPRLKPCVRIEWEHGGYLECSIDHPILKQIVHIPRVNGTNVRKRTPDEVWVKADELKAGDRIIEGRYIGAFGTDTLEDARLVGMLIGDGSYGYDNTPKFSSEDEELLNYVKERYEWGVSGQHITKEGKLYQDIRVKGICPLLRKIGIFAQTKTAKRLPARYQTLTEEDTKLLLAGLYDTDGCITGMGNAASIELTQATREILEQVAILLRKFGITSSIAKNKPSIKEGRMDKNPWYILTVAGRTNIELFYENIPLIQHRKVNKLKEVHQWFVEHPLIRTRCYDDKKIIPHTIRKIEYIGVQVIYNLSAEQSHTYLANNIVTHNTAGDSMSDFTALQEIMYNPKGYNMLPLQNVYDKEGQGRPSFTLFFPAYLNRSSCMDKDGNSDVTKALLEILMDRYTVKYNSTDINAITKRISQYPITPQEAIVKSHGSIFPVTELNERLNQIDNNPNEYDDVYVGELVMNSKTGQVEFRPTSDIPIREFPTKDNKVAGAIEIFSMPQKGSDGKVPYGRYIGAADPYINDAAETMSLGSFFMLDTWTDTIVMEYTGRPTFADDYYEICRLACLFYNAQALFESNKKGYFPYFQQKNSLHLLADTPEYLLEKQLVKGLGFGNSRKGVTTTVPIKNFGFGLIRDWLLKPVTKIVRNDEGKEEEITVSNLYNIRNRALLKELILYNPNINVDRISALVMLMIFREEKMVLFQGDMKRGGTQISGMENDDYFRRNFKGGHSKWGAQWTMYQ